MILRDVVMMVVVAGILVSGIFFVIGNFGITSSNDEYNTYITNVRGNLSGYDTSLAENISGELESGEAEVSTDSSDISMGSSAYKVFKMVLDVPRVAFNIMNDTGKAIGLPTFFIKGLLALTLVIISFLILTVIARIKS